jgi:hypothetical protein
MKIIQTTSITGAFLLASQTILQQPKGAHAVDCGKWYSNECVGETDKRYDPNYPIDLLDLNPIWGHLNGYWIQEFLVMADPNSETSLRVPSFYNPNLPVTGGNLPYTIRYAFYNETFQGSRYHSNRYYIMEPADEGFCNQTPPIGLSNVFGDGTCGSNGYAVSASQFGTTSYENDGSITMIGAYGLYIGGPDQNGTILPIDDRTFYAATIGSSGVLAPISYVFLNNYTQIAGQSAVLLTKLPEFVPLGFSPVTSVTVFLSTKVTKDEWLAAISAEYERSNVREEDRIQNGQLPMVGGCLDDPCLTEEDWCALDPACSESPYQEPDAEVKAGPIVGFVLLGVAILSILAYLWHRHQIAIIMKSNRLQFARRIAETIRFESSHRQLTPDALAEEFKRIDKEGNGVISKDALWSFLSTGKAGNIEESAFNALFAAMDLNGSGAVDFLEFCAFMGQCHDDFEKVKNNKSVRHMRPSFVAEVAGITARRLTISRPSIASQMAPMEEEATEPHADEDEA